MESTRYDVRAVGSRMGKTNYSAFLFGPSFDRGFIPLGCDVF